MTATPLSTIQPLRSIFATFRTVVKTPFIRYCHETRRIAFRDLWIIGHPNGNPDGQCLQLTCQWVQDFLSSWTTWPLTADLLKQGGYIRIQLSQRGRRTTARTPSEHLAVPDKYSTPSLRSRSTSSQSPRGSSRSQNFRRRLVVCEVVSRTKGEAKL
jgi:hypothetical protein